jgi:hypothetical protein
MNLKLTQVNLNKLDITSGAITELEPAILSINEPVSRATLKTGNAQVACVQFRHLGPTSRIEQSKSGQEFHQIGLKLRSLNPCNLIYVMWRIKPQPKLIILLKRNKGQSTSAECRNRGYTTLAEIPFQHFLVGQFNELMACVQTHPDGQGEVRCWVNWQEVLQAPVGADVIQAVNGPPGIRTDNGQYHLRFLTAD